MSSRPCSPFDRLPRFRREHVAFVRRIARALPRVVEADTRAWLGVPLGVAPLPVARCTAEEARDHLRATLTAVVLAPRTPGDGGRIAVELEPRLTALVIDRTLGGDGRAAAYDVGTLTPVERGVLLYAAARVAASLTLAHAVEAVVTTPEALEAALGPGTWGCVPARVSLGDDVAHARAWIPERAAPNAALEARVPCPAWVGALPCVLAIVGARGALSAHALAALAVGDVVLVDAWTARPRGAAGEGVAGIEGEVRLEARGASRALVASIVEGGLRVERIESARPASKRGEVVGSMERAASDGEWLEVAGEVPVEVSVELGRVEITVAELASVCVGEIVRTGRRVGETVALRVGDHLVARGELVDVDGELGVRITSLARRDV